MGSVWSIAIILGPVLLLAAVIYAWARNRNAGPEIDRRAEQGARDLRRDIEEEHEKPVDL